MSSSEDDILATAKIALRDCGACNASLSVGRDVVVVNNDRDRAVRGRTPESKWCEKEAMRKERPRASDRATRTIKQLSCWTEGMFDQEWKGSSNKKDLEKIRSIFFSLTVAVKDDLVVIGLLAVREPPSLFALDHSFRNVILLLRKPTVK